LGEAAKKKEPKEKSRNTGSVSHEETFNKVTARCCQKRGKRPLQRGKGNMQGEKCVDFGQEKST